MVDLRSESEQVRKVWQASDEAHVPFHLAAALAFHEACPAAHAFIAGTDYEDALNLAAAALSCVVNVYALHPRTGQPVPVEVNLKGGKFLDGGAAYRRGGGPIVTSLVVRRDEVAAALNLVKTAGIPFHFLNTEAHLR